MMNIRKILSPLLTLAFFLVSCLTASAAGYTITDLLAGKTRPDRPGEGYSLFGTASISGNRVVFATRAGGVPDAVWSIDISTRAIIKLAGLGTAAPGGVGTFACFCLRFAIDDATPRVGGNMVAFFALDADSNSGLYTVPITGGTVRRIAGTRSTIPFASRFERFGQGVSLNGDWMVFYGQLARGNYGIYKARVDGTGLATFIDERVNLPARRRGLPPAPNYYFLYNRMVIGLSASYFGASGLFDPSTGANAIFNNSRDLVIDYLAVPQGGTSDHLRILNLSAPLDLARVVFSADQPATRLTGIFRRSGTDSALAFVTSAMTAPGSTKTFQSFGGLCADEAGVAFNAVVDDAQGVYLSPGTGLPSVLIAAHGATYYKPTVGDRCLDRGRVIFREDGGANRLLLAVRS